MQRNKTTGERRWKENTAAKNNEIKKLELKVKMFSNEARRLKRNLNKYGESGDNNDADNINSTASEALMNSFSQRWGWRYGVWSWGR